MWDYSRIVYRMKYFAALLAGISVAAIGYLAIVDMWWELREIDRSIFSPIRACLRNLVGALTKVRFTIAGLLKLFCFVALACMLTNVFGAYAILFSVGISPVLLNFLRRLIGFPIVRFGFSDLLMFNVIAVGISVLIPTELPYFVAWGSLISSLLLTLICQNALPASIDSDEAG